MTEGRGPYMRRLIPVATAISCTLMALPAAAQDEFPPDCRIIRTLPDGRVLETPPREAAAAKKGSASSLASASGPGTSRSSVAVSTSSRGGGSASSSASSHSDANGRSVTVTRDDRGCVVTIREPRK